MPSPEIWVEILALTKALFEATKSGLDLFKTYEKYSKDPETRREAQRVSQVFSTYSKEELDSILRRLEGCRDRFVEQGGGKDRANCLCSVLDEVRDGNGGMLPSIDDWQRIYSQLNCGRNA